MGFSGPNPNTSILEISTPLSGFLEVMQRSQYVQDQKKIKNCNDQESLFHFPNQGNMLVCAVVAYIRNGFLLSFGQIRTAACRHIRISEVSGVLKILIQVGTALNFARLLPTHASRLISSLQLYYKTIGKIYQVDPQLS